MQKYPESTLNSLNIQKRERNEILKKLDEKIEKYLKLLELLDERYILKEMEKEEYESFKGKYNDAIKSLK